MWRLSKQEHSQRELKRVVDTRELGRMTLYLALGSLVTDKGDKYRRGTNISKEDSKIGTCVMVGDVGYKQKDVTWCLV